jgi:uncharacterized protein VirK/YbjX
MTANGLSFHTLWRLLAEPAAWSPARLIVRFRKLFLATVHAPYQLRILVTLSHPAYRGLRRVYPRLPFKYLEEQYLVRGFTLRERAACLLHHYRRLKHRLPHRVLRGISDRAAVLMEMRREDTCYAVTMGLPELFQDEGELSLHLQVDGAAVFVLSFTVVPGWVVESKAADVLLITRLQGVPGVFAQIHRVTKALHDVAPGALLVAALQGIAEAWEIREMAGVCARNHRSYEEACAAQLTAAYDAFFTELGAVRNGKELFVSPLPLAQKPLSRVKPGHKLRTREKRAFKTAVAAQVLRTLSEL